MDKVKIKYTIILSSHPDCGKSGESVEMDRSVAEHWIKRAKLEHSQSVMLHEIVEVV